MLIKSKDKKTVLTIGEVAGFEVIRGRIYPPGEERSISGYLVNAILAGYDNRIPLGTYEAETDAVKAMGGIEQWVEQGGEGIFEVA